MRMMLGLADLESWCVQGRQYWPFWPQGHHAALELTQSESLLKFATDLLGDRPVTQPITRQTSVLTDSRPDNMHMLVRRVGVLHS